MGTYVEFIRIKGRLRVNPFQIAGVLPDPDTSRHDLTICVYSYNRGLRLRTLCDYLVPQIAHLGDRIEILVSDNQSTDNTQELLADLESPQLRVIRQPVHLGSGEEHIFAAVRSCRGKFVWCLGDDDIPKISTIISVLDLIQTDQYDFFLFNSLFAHGSGKLTGHSFIRMNGPLVATSFKQGALALGFTSTLAGVSNAIFRRDTALSAPHDDLLRISHIYSHLVWWFRGFSAKRLCFVNQPLVVYRVEDSPDLLTHFDKVAERQGVPTFSFWASSLIRFFELMEEEGLIDSHQMVDTWDHDRLGGMHSSVDQIIGNMMEAVKASLSAGGNPRNIYRREVFERDARWILRLNPRYLDCVICLSKILEISDLGREGRELEIDRYIREFFQSLEAKISDNAYPSFVRSLRGYDLHRHRFGAVAFRQGSQINRQEVLNFIDPAPQGRTVLVADSVEQLAEKIENSPAYEQAGEPTG